MKVDICFRLNGSEIPADHGYSLYSALSKRLPWVHEGKDIGLHPISGRPTAERKLSLSHTSHLILRLPPERIGEVLPLAGQALDIDGHNVRIGVPITCALIPSARLYSRLVVIKGFMEPEGFLQAFQKQMSKAGIQGNPSLITQPHVAQANKKREGGSHSPFLRRTLKIRDKEVVGFAVRVEELTADESILLQEKGIGGRRKMGCGIFVPDRR